MSSTLEGLAGRPLGSQVLTFVCEWGKHMKEASHMVLKGVKNVNPTGQV